VKLTVFNEEGPDSTETNWTFHEWHDKLRESGFIILPHIAREGACILHDDNTVGLLVKNGTANYSYDELLGGLYSYIIDATGTRRFLSAMKTLNTLLAVGSVVYVDLNDPTLQHLKDKIPRGQQQLHWLEVRLNAPTVHNPTPDKVYVTYMLRPTKANTNVCFVSSTTMELNVWDLTVTLPDDTEVISALLM
jgi:hypothetical protein